MDGGAEIKLARWGLPASAAAHALVAALVIFGLPSLPQMPEEEEVVEVTLEPPPEPPELEPEPAEAAPPQPPAAAEAAPPPPPPAEPAAPLRDQAAAAPFPTLDPVVRFGEADAGSRRSLDGAGAQDKPEPPFPSTALEEPATSGQAPEENTEEARSETPAEDEQAPPAKAESEETETPQGEAQASSEDETTGSAADALVASIVTAPDKAEPPASSQASTQATAGSEPELREARTLFSRSATGDPTATTAMAGIPRGIRAGRLCATELRLQLLASAYSPDLLPSYRLDEGTLLKVRRSAFRAGGAWHSLSFECRVDARATGVRSFALHVGDPLSRDETMRRGLPMR